MASAPSILPENTGLAFIGESAWTMARLTEGEAALIFGATNACGRPNSDVVRKRLDLINHEPVVSWQIDFPDHFSGQEAALYEEPFAHLQRQAPTWKNPRANLALRRALARTSRYLAMPAHDEVPDWIWIEEESIPDESLVVVARDDDFTHGILASDAFAAWYRTHFVRMPADQLVESFPFPWPPSTGLSDLSAAQGESRHAVVRAIRAGNREALHEAVCRVYGWSLDVDATEISALLQTLHRHRNKL